MFLLVMLPECRPPTRDQHADITGGNARDLSDLTLFEPLSGQQQDLPHLRRQLLQSPLEQLLLFQMLMEIHDLGPIVIMLFPL
jgi:hypothetical protein